MSYRPNPNPNPNPKLPPRHNTPIMPSTIIPSSHVPLLHKSYHADHAFTRVLVLTDSHQMKNSNYDTSKALRQCAQLIAEQAPA